MGEGREVRDGIQKRRWAGRSEGRESEKGMGLPSPPPSLPLRVPLVKIVVLAVVCVCVYVTGVVYSVTACPDPQCSPLITAITPPPPSLHLPTPYSLTHTLHSFPFYFSSSSLRPLASLLLPP